MIRYYPLKWTGFHFVVDGKDCYIQDWQGCEIYLGQYPVRSYLLVMELANEIIRTEYAKYIIA